MKFSFKHFDKFISEKVTFSNLSDKLFQLGHENSIDQNLIDVEITPNRGDCLSLLGILRELKSFYSVDLNFEIYDREIGPLNLNFENKAINECPNIAFLEIKIDEIPKKYKPYLEDYFNEMNIKKINFFTDVSNYLSYEIGQPTHCYDFDAIGNSFKLENDDINKNFMTLQGKSINLVEKNLIFTKDGKVINLAGIMGGKETACKTNTNHGLIESAFFKPEAIIGKSTKYDLNSDAAYKFERGVDPEINEFALRRFIKIVADHASIKHLKIYTQKNKNSNQREIPFDLKKIEQILGVNIDKNDCKEFLEKLDFKFTNTNLVVPSHRHDISNLNDIAEEVARIIGYNNLPSKKFLIRTKKLSKPSKEIKVKHFLASKGFFEVINYPFSANKKEDSISIVNPLDSNKSYFRRNIVDSLLSNLVFNERRQKDSIKIFEVSDLYSQDLSSREIILKRRIGIIVSGRKGHNYRDFNSIIDYDFLREILNNLSPDITNNIKEIPRESINSKLKFPIFSAEFDLDDLDGTNEDLKKIPFEIGLNTTSKKYVQVSEFPLVNRDLSFLIKDPSQVDSFVNFSKNIKNDLIKKSFMFDLYENKEKNLMKIGFRFVFQSKRRTLTDLEVDKVISDIVESILMKYDIEIPGYKN